MRRFEGVVGADLVARAAGGSHPARVKILAREFGVTYLSARRVYERCGKRLDVALAVFELSRRTNRTTEEVLRGLKPEDEP